MYDDDGSPSLAYYADALGSCEHESCAVAMSRMIWLDMAEFWTESDTYWLLLMLDKISTGRAMEAMTPRKRRFRLFSRGKHAR